MLEWLSPIVTIIIGVLGPVLTVMALLHRERSKVLTAIGTQVAHIDDCVDSLKIQIVSYAGRAVTRDEVDATLLRMREGISGDTRGLHDRIMRLENRFLASHE